MITNKINHSIAYIRHSLTNYLKLIYINIIRKLVTCYTKIVSLRFVVKYILHVDKHKHKDTHSDSSLAHTTLTFRCIYSSSRYQRDEILRYSVLL